MSKIKRSEIESEDEVCVYCGDSKGEKYSCCKENHFEEAYITGEDYHIKSETEVIEGE